MSLTSIIAKQKASKRGDKGQDQSLSSAGCPVDSERSGYVLALVYYPKVIRDKKRTCSQAYCQSMSCKPKPIYLLFSLNAVASIYLFPPSPADPLSPVRPFETTTTRYSNLQFCSADQYVSPLSYRGTRLNRILHLLPVKVRLPGYNQRAESRGFRVLGRRAPDR